jgi:RHS repeat-associated protein
MDETDAFTWTHGDHLGSASAATNTAGNILWRESYTPFGEVMEDPSANRDEAGFTGHVRDAATGLTYAQARYYNPVTARFLAPDPVGFAEAGWRHFNRYGYAYNDPVNATDPTGEIPVETVWDAANVGMGAASFTGNARSGNWGGAAVDAVGVLVDTAATLIPYVPGGAGAAIKATRAGAEVVQGARQAREAVDGSRAIPEPSTGPGSAPRGQRDPQRRFTGAQKQEMIDRQGGQCGNNCGIQIAQSNSDAHHIQRHADGGRTTTDNGVAVCKDCHREIHRPNRE